MAEYCKQCHDELFPPDSGFMTNVRSQTVICEGCGETVVDSKGRCTGACGKDSHTGSLMNYIFETKNPSLQFFQVEKYTFRIYVYKILVDLLQWVPRFTFLGCLVYLAAVALAIRIRELLGKDTGNDLRAELFAAKANNVYQASLNFWYKNETKLDQLLF